MTARLAGLPQLTADPTPDAELLRRFAAGRDEYAFRELVRRHGRLVFGVCRRAVGDRHLAEDAFQAVFLVLARKATSVRDGSKLSSWLHGVAVRVGRRAQRTEQRRRWKAGLDYEPAAVVRSSDSELIAAVDAEIDRLPEAYRVPLILCELEGVSRSAAAARLNLAEGTLSSRLAAGRKKLAANLTRRGVVLGVVFATPVTVPAAVIESTIELTSGGRVPAELLSLAFGRPAMRTFLLAGATLMAAVGAAAVAQQTPPVPPKPPEAVKVVEAKPAEPGPAYTKKPKMRQVYDLSGSVHKIWWSADGYRAAFESSERIEKQTIRLVHFVELDVWAGTVARTIATFHVEEDVKVSDVRLDKGELRVVGILDRGGQINTVRAVQVYTAKLPAGWPVKLMGDADLPQFKLSLSVPLPAGQSVWPYFRPTGPDLVLFLVRGGYGESSESLEFADLDAKAEDPVKVFHAVKSPDGKRITWKQIESRPQAVAAVDAAGSLFLSTFEKRGEPAKVLATQLSSVMSSSIAVSPDAAAVAFAPPFKEAFASGSGGPVRQNEELTTPVAKVYRVGSEAVKLAATDSVVSQFGGFSGDGRLLSGTTQEYRIRGAGRQQSVTFLQTTNVVVWDAKTGEQVKSWKGSATTAFAPNKPVLAVAEPIGNNRTRIGFWDFSPTK